MGGVGGLLKICMFLCKDEMMKNYNDSNKNNIEKKNRDGCLEKNSIRKAVETFL
jgi:tartrate dehydratase alpha subunit/fumarate hydratase class I-like protein